MREARSSDGMRWAGGLVDAADQEAGLRRMIALRWVASAAAFAGLGLAAWRIPATQLGIPFAIAALIPGSNLIHRGLLRGRHSGRSALLVQFAADLVILTTLLGSLGGIDGPPAALFLVHAILGALWLDRREAIVVALLAMGLVDALAAAQVLGAPFPVRAPGVLSMLLGLPAPLNAAPTFVLGVAVTLNLLAAVLLYLLLPLVAAARAHAARALSAERRWREHGAALERLLDNMGAMMMVLDGTHHVVWFNHTMKDRFPAFEIGQERRCYDPAEPMGGGEATKCPSCRVIETGEPWSGDYSLAIPGREPLVLCVYATPMIEGSERQVVELIIDVTQERKSSRELLEARKTAAVAVLAAGVAHEMSTPLASIAMGLRALRQSQPAPGNHHDSHAETLDLLRVEAERCQKIVESMLGYSRQLRTHLRAAEVEAVVQDALSDLAVRRDLKGIEIVFAGPSPETPSVVCDPDHLRLVVVNILTNAVDAVREAKRMKPRVHVEIRTSERRDKVGIHVRDNGVGMTPEVQARALDPFFTTKPAGAGAGLGLAVSQGLLAPMQGAISVESEPGQEGAYLLVSLRAAGANGEELPQALPEAHA